MDSGGSCVVTKTIKIIYILRNIRYVRGGGMLCAAKHHQYDYLFHIHMYLDTYHYSEKRWACCLSVNNEYIFSIFCSFFSFLCDNAFFARLLLQINMVTTLDDGIIWAIWWGYCAFIQKHFLSLQLAYVVSFFSL